MFIVYTQTHNLTWIVILIPLKQLILLDFIFFILWKRNQGSEALCDLPQEFWYGFAGGLYLKVFHKPAIHVSAGAALISRLDWGRPLSVWCQDSVLQGLSVSCCMGFTTSQQHGFRLPSEPERERERESEQTETRVFL